MNRILKKNSGYILTPLLLALAYPPFNLCPVAFFSFIPIFYQLEKKKSFFKLFLSGFFFNTILLYWLFPVLTDYGDMSVFLAIISLIILFSYLALFFSIPLYFLKKNFIYLFPVFFVGFEVLLEYLLTGFPWNILANSQGANIGINYMFNFFGVRGVSIFILLANILIFQALKKNNKFRLILTLSMIILLNIPGYLKNKKEFNKKIIVSVVQGNESMDTEWTDYNTQKEFKKYMKYTKISVGEGAKIIVWPEFCFLYHPLFHKTITYRLKSYTLKNDITIILGGQFSEGENYYNTAFIFSKGKINHYFKTHLTPFGEYIPFKEIFFFVNKIAHVEGEFSPGDKIKIHKINNINTGVPICFEIIFPSLIKKFYKKNTELLITISNDSWFKKTSGPYQHFNISRIRAMESGVPMIRSTTNGISGFISQNGKILKTIGYNQEGYSISKINIPSSICSFYYENFLLFEVLIIAFSFIYTILLLISYLFKKKQN